jgi:hypothetical protein
MNNDFDINSLIKLEKKHKLWNQTLLGYPLWIHCREQIVIPQNQVKKIKKPNFFNIVKSFLKTAVFLFKQNKYDNVYFLMEREELLEIYRQDKNKKKLFLNTNENKFFKNYDFISSEFLNILRFLSRKISYIIFFVKYKKIINKLDIIIPNINVKSNIKNAFGDALFLKFLSLIFTKKNKKFYSGSVIPMGEKFLNSLNSFEVQHGVIHSSHVGYVEVPDVKNTLILYDGRYIDIMLSFKYLGKLSVIEYKKNFLTKHSNRYYSIVIYTQPVQEIQNGVELFFSKNNPSNVYIQRHPNDCFNYSIDSKYFVKSTIPSEVGTPIAYTSSIIENFTLIGRVCKIYDIGINDKLVDFLKVYGDKNLFIISNDLENLINQA